MKISRADVTTDQQAVNCPNASWIGFSTSTLSPGMFFVYKEESGSPALALMHARIVRTDEYCASTHPSATKEESNPAGRILAQRADASMTSTGERWIDPAQVIETIPAHRMHEGIRRFFEHAAANQIGTVDI